MPMKMLQATVNNHAVQKAEVPSGQVCYRCLNLALEKVNYNQSELFSPEVKMDDGKLLLTTRAKNTKTLRYHSPMDKRYFGFSRNSSES